MENIPDDILTNIFMRLMAKQLGQMRCVSKSWNALLSESSFIKSHLDRSIQNNKNDGILLVIPSLISFDSKPITSRPSHSPDLELTDFIKLPVNTQSENSRVRVVGSVNGLICFIYGSNHNGVLLYNTIDDFAFNYGSHQYPEVIYIWNPSLSALLTLPSYNMPSHSIQQIFRFGFDPKTNDYKVVKITRRLLTSPNTVGFMEWLPVEVYSMRKGSWKVTTQRIPSHIKKLRNFDDLCVDGHGGHLHWGGYYSKGNKYSELDTIVAFDLGAETFHEIPLPHAVTANDVWISLGVLAGKLCVMSHARPDYEFVVWVMDEYGVAESWVKHHVFTPFGRYLYPYGFTSQNEFLFQVSNHVLRCDHALYDPVASKTNIFKLGYYNCRVRFVEYVDRQSCLGNTYRAAREELKT